MKNIFKTILCIASLIVPAYSAFAQEQQYVPDVYHYQNADGTGLVYSKEVQGPNEKGEYTIFLKSFVTGEVDEETIKIPSEIVLVLDVSGSMNYGMSDDDFTSAGNSFSPNYIDSNTLLYKRGKDDYYRVRIEEDYGGYYMYVNIDGTDYYFTRNGDLTTNFNQAYIRSRNQTIYSGSLYKVIDNNHTRLAHLKNAVDFFIDEIRKDNEQNKVALVKFADDSYYPGETATSTRATGNNRRNNGSNYSEIVNGFLACTSSQLKTNVSSLIAGGATAADYGMNKAQALINSLFTGGNPDDDTNKLVVFFTDGAPTYSSGFEDNVANAAVSSAKRIKALTSYSITTESGKTFTDNVKVYTIGTFANPSDKVKTYMSRLSSNYPNATGIGTGQQGADGSDLKGYSFMATNQEELLNAFASISSDVVTPDVTVNSSSTVVDVMSKSFTLPTNANPSTVQVWETTPTGYDKTTKQYLFSIKKSDWTNITEALGDNLDIDDKTNTISVTGWEFGKNACCQKKDGSVIGKQLILEIPIEMGPNAVGGPGVGTNGAGSGISYQDENGNKKNLYFDTPNIGLPINLHIRKEGLKVGESAKFKIQRMWDGKATIPSDVTITPNKWQDYTSVFVTRRSSDSETGENAPLVKIVGLHPGFTYRIIEEDWSWSYGLSKVHGSKYVINPDTQVETTSDIEMSNGSSDNNWEGNTVLSTSINLNPFIFVNAKKAVEVENGVTSVRHAESIVRNEFSKATSAAQAGASEYSKEQPKK